MILKGPCFVKHHTKMEIMVSYSSNVSLYLWAITIIEFQFDPRNSQI